MAKKISLDLIKKVRSDTGAGMIDVKKALEEAEGDVDRAKEILREKGVQAAGKREGRKAQEGLVLAKIVEEGGKKVGYAIELNTETDFVAKTPQFVAYAKKILQIAVEVKAKDRVELLEAKGKEESVKEIIDSAAALFKENIKLGQVGRVEGEEVNLYAHKKSAEFPPSIVALVASDENGAKVAHDVALQVSAMSPFWLSEEDVPADVIESESRIAEGKAKQEGKKEAIIGKIVEGRIKSFYEETVLLDQKFVKDPSKTVGQIVKEAGGTITAFLRIEVGKGEEESKEAEE